MKNLKRLEIDLAGAEIIRFRTKNNLSQPDLAYLLNCSAGRIWRWERSSSNEIRHINKAAIKYLIDHYEVSE